MHKPNKRDGNMWNEILYIMIWIGLWGLIDSMVDNYVTEGTYKMIAFFGVVFFAIIFLCIL